MLTLAADDADDLEQAVAEHSAHAANHKVEVRTSNAPTPYPEPCKGREHFGFRDGVSQPGIEGYTRPKEGARDPEDADHPGARIVARKHSSSRTHPTG